MTDELIFPALFERDGVRVSESPWGPGDEIGRLNWMTPESRAQALRRADGARPFDLAVDYFMGMPAWTVAGDPKYDIWMTHTPDGSPGDGLEGVEAEALERTSYAGTAVTMYTHVGTHLCGLNHIGHHGRFWNGWTAAERLGSRAWRVGGRYPPIIARGVLLDVAASKGEDCLSDSYAITAEDLREACAVQSVELRQGDVVLVRTGRMTRWPDREAFMEAPPGLGLAAARYLCEEAGTMCIGVDAGGEALPPEQPGTFLPVHAYLLATAGAPLFENVWLEELAEASEYEFAFLAFPLKLAGSTGAPTRPVALPCTG
jgi:kynurenine formamidase